MRPHLDEEDLDDVMHPTFGTLSLECHYIRNLFTNLHVMVVVSLLNLLYLHS
jgi:hypothetical protein